MKTKEILSLLSQFSVELSDHAGKLWMNSSIMIWICDLILVLAIYPIWQEAFCWESCIVGSLILCGTLL